MLQEGLTPCAQGHIALARTHGEESLQCDGSANCKPRQSCAPTWLLLGASGVHFVIFTTFVFIYKSDVPWQRAGIGAQAWRTPSRAYARGVNNGSQGQQETRPACGGGATHPESGTTPQDKSQDKDGERNKPEAYDSTRQQHGGKAFGPRCQLTWFWIRSGHCGPRTTPCPPARGAQQCGCVAIPVGQSLVTPSRAWHDPSNLARSTLQRALK